MEPKKVRIITVIAGMLLEEHGKVLSSDEFDQLYDLDIEDLVEVQTTIVKQIKANKSYSK